MNPERAGRFLVQQTPYSLPGYEASVDLTLCTSVKVRGNPNLALLYVLNEMLEDNGKQCKRLHKKKNY